MHSNKPAVTANQHSIAAFTFITLLPLVYYIPPWLTRNVSDNHFLVTVLALLIIVPVVSYIALPLFFRSLDRLNTVTTQSEKN